MYGKLLEQASDRPGLHSQG